MRSKKMDRSPTAENHFEHELLALQNGIRCTFKPSGRFAEECQKLMSVALSYIDELNKVRRYACPLSTNILLSSIMESLLLALILQRSYEAAKTRTWAKILQDTKRSGQRINPEVPVFYLAELIQIANDLKLLQTSGVQEKVGRIGLEEITEKYARKSNVHINTSNIQFDPVDARRNLDLMHTLRGFRNSVHPVHIISGGSKDEPGDFLTAIWNGLTLLILLNKIFEFESPMSH
jgi:hypothetical protein